MTTPSRSSLGPWLLACVLVICATVLVLTGHQAAMGPTVAGLVLALVVLGLKGRQDILGPSVMALAWFVFGFIVFTIL